MANLEETEALLKEVYDHLEYCGYGDAWERSCATELIKKLENHFNQNKEKTNENQASSTSR